MAKYSNDIEHSSLPAELQKLASSVERGELVAIVLGSGLGSFVDSVEVESKISYSDIAGLPSSGVEGHSGHFVVGSLPRSGKKLLIAQGRVHLYEGYDAKAVCSLVRVMAAAGASQLVLTNAAGSINSEYAPSQWMRIVDHINLTGTSPLLGAPHFIDMSELYRSALGDAFEKAAEVSDAALCRGVYAGLLGPQYETPAEIRMLRQMGADAVGMSTVLEAIQAKALGMEVAGFSCLTNWAAGIESGKLGEQGTQNILDHSEVIEVGQQAAAHFVELMQAVLS